MTAAQEPRTLPADTVDRYLDRIGLDRTSVTLDLGGLTRLQRAHLTAVPFENLDIVAGVEVRTDLDWSVPKIVDRRRGGWCFELNGAFGALLSSLGFDVIVLGAAVLLGGPSTVIDHACLEVMVGRPRLVDVGFGDSFIVPLDLTDPEPQDGGTGTYQFLPSPQGTTLAEIVDGVPEARYRFKRVAHSLADFEPASTRLRFDPESLFHQKPFATRLLDQGPDRITLLSDVMKHRVDGVTTETPLDPAGSDDPAAWDALADRWFGPTVRWPAQPG